MKTLSEWFNTAAFAAPPAGYFGNAAPGSIVGPGTVNFDMALAKDFNLGERVMMNFRSEFFNIFNHTNFNGIKTTFGAGISGRLPVLQTRASSSLPCASILGVLCLIPRRTLPESRREQPWRTEKGNRMHRPSQRLVSASLTLLVAFSTAVAQSKRDPLKAGFENPPEVRARACGGTG